MPLDKETIERLLASKSTPRTKAAPAGAKASTGARARRNQIRIKTQYPELVPNPYVMRYVGKGQSVSLPCTSYGCRAPSYHLFKGTALCSIHLIYALTYELVKLGPLTSRSNITSGDDSPDASCQGAAATGTSPLALVINEGGEDDDYL